MKRLIGLLTSLPILAHFPAFAEPFEGYATYYTVASCVKEGTSGIYTASGEPYSETGLTCALPNHRFGGFYEVCHMGKCVTVRHNDFGPGRKPRSRGVVIDLTPRAFQELDSLSKGKVAVTVRKTRR